MSYNSRPLTRSGVHIRQCIDFHRDLPYIYIYLYGEMSEIILAMQCLPQRNLPCTYIWWNKDCSPYPAMHCLPQRDLPWTYIRWNMPGNKLCNLCMYSWLKLTIGEHCCNPPVGKIMNEQSHTFTLSKLTTGQHCFNLPVGKIMNDKVIHSKQCWMSPDEPDEKHWWARALLYLVWGKISTVIKPVKPILKLLWDCQIIATTAWILEDNQHPCLAHADMLETCVACLSW